MKEKFEINNDGDLALAKLFIAQIDAVGDIEKDKETFDADLAKHYALEETLDDTELAAAAQFFSLYSSYISMKQSIREYEKVEQKKLFKEIDRAREKLRTGF